jgi:hypothetical protein
MENSFSTSTAVSQTSGSMKVITQLDANGTRQSERRKTDPSSGRHAVLSSYKAIPVTCHGGP